MSAEWKQNNRVCESGCASLFFLLLQKYLQANSADCSNTSLAAKPSFVTGEKGVASVVRKSLLVEGRKRRRWRPESGCLVVGVSGSLLWCPPTDAEYIPLPGLWLIYNTPHSSRIKSRLVDAAALNGWTLTTPSRHLLFLSLRGNPIFLLFSIQMYLFMEK